MFRAKASQGSLFETSMLLPEDKLRRLEQTWAGVFQTAALPLIDEEAFRGLYCANNGRPNKPVQTIVGLLLLKEMWDFTDEQALFNLDFNLAWQMALDLTPEEAHCCQKTLHNFRAKLMENDRAKLLFEEMTAGVIEALGVQTEQQRLDSTHIISNIAKLTRLGLFCETTRVFLGDLRKAWPTRFEEIPAGLRGRYFKEDGSDRLYGDARSSEARRRLSVCARDVWRLVDRFRGDAEVKAMASYGLLERLLKEQCEVHEEASIETDAHDASEGAAPVSPKAPKDISSASLQSPHDADVTYSGHKGKGYEIQVAETCGNEDKPEVITHVGVTRSCDSDDAETVPTVENLAEREIQPKELFTDTTYGSTENVMVCEELGTEVVSPVAGPKLEESSEEDGRNARKVTKADFDVDPKGESKTLCPAGQEAVRESRDAESGHVNAYFDGDICARCEHRDGCPAKAQRDGTRVLRTTVQAAVLVRRRRYEATEAFRKRYAIRAGIEATNSELKRAHGLGRLRIRGILRVRVAVYLKALACNVKRMVQYMAKEAKKSQTEAAEELSSVRSPLSALLVTRFSDRATSRCVFRIWAPIFTLTAAA